MRKKDDNAHINLSELDAILKGVNMALKWSVSDINIKTDSATVYGWLNSSLYSTHTIKTKGMNEMLSRRELLWSHTTNPKGFSSLVQWRMEISMH